MKTKTPEWRRSGQQWQSVDSFGNGRATHKAFVLAHTSKFLLYGLEHFVRVHIWQAALFLLLLGHLRSVAFHRASMVFIDGSVSLFEVVFVGHVE